MTEYVTKDSGERATFDSGMQRDTQAGKPRFDLMIPEGVPYEEQMITRFAKLLGRGAEKYDDRNWEKADSEAEMARMKSSAFRHFMQWLCGETDEDHAAGTIFNILAFETTRYKVDADEGDAKAAEPQPIPADEDMGYVSEDSVRIYRGNMPSETAKKLGMHEGVVQNIQMHFNDGEDKIARAREISKSIDDLRNSPSAQTIRLD